jgi:tetratricopeptide (TPR) repeat protein
MSDSKNTASGPTSNFSIVLPDPPPDLVGPVKAWRQDVEILTYLPEMPELNPMFLEKRVYQGSSGRVYPLPFIDRISTHPQKKMWTAIHIENEYLRIMILPEIGGRIHIGYDKTTGYDFFYRQNVIKPALVGLAGPWASGGVEFNWPQHHRPATFMPVETEIEELPDGSIIIWCSDHDPMLHMKGMHGVCLRPGRAVLELKVRLFNRTQLTQTFLWWANVATRVHEKYQSFFPRDVRFVADHAKRAITSFPLSNGTYYGVNYGERAKTGVPAEERPDHFVPDGSYPPNDLSWYANIPVPTSYMVAGTEQDFCGGYDHKVQAGVVHVANHHIAPGKKQWTWGNHAFGYAWDRSLTDADGPYIELMAGVYTDNQPDFSYLAPWETKTFSQNWYPIHAIGTPAAANENAAISLRCDKGNIEVGVHVTQPTGEVTVVLKCTEKEIARWNATVTVAHPLLLQTAIPEGVQENQLTVTAFTGSKTLIEFSSALTEPAPPPVVAQEPAPPASMQSVEELYLTGLHLEQYRHATRQPETYWEEALRRDPNESRVHNAMGLWRLRRGEFQKAAEHFEAAIARLTRLNPNPRDGEPYYNLGLTRRYLGQEKQAYDALYKATWSAAWRSAAYLALAECDAAHADWSAVQNHAQRSLRADADNLNARHLLALALNKDGNPKAADAVYAETLALDPLDVAARWRRGVALVDTQAALDLAFDLLRAGQYHDTLNVLETITAQGSGRGNPMVLFATAYVQNRLGFEQYRQTLEHAEASSLDYCFPSRLEEMLVLEWAIGAQKNGWVAHYLLGNLLYDKRRHHEAVLHWEAAAAQAPNFSIVHRNLGIAYFNVFQDPDRAVACFDQAFSINQKDARLLYERDQLWKRIGRSAQDRIGELLRYPKLISQRDDLSVELSALYNQTNLPEEALSILEGRKFQPWEGGEGFVLAQYTRAHMLLGCRALAAALPMAARDEFLVALAPPENLSEARHLLANQSEMYYWIGEACHRTGDMEAAAHWWRRAARQKGDFQQMSLRVISEMSFWSALALQRLGCAVEARTLFEQIHDYSVTLENAVPKIDYFATSLPAMLLFEEDLQWRNRIDVLFFRAQAAAGLGHADEAAVLLHQVLAADGNHVGAADLLGQPGHLVTAEATQ